MTLRIRPRDFWRLPFEEWRWLIAPMQEDVLTRSQFLKLTQHYPDQPHGQ